MSRSRPRTRQPVGQITPPIPIESPAVSAPSAPLVPERSNFLDGDTPAADRVEAFLANALEATGGDAPTTVGALVPWICDVLLSNHSVKAYGRDLMDFLRQMQAQGVTPLDVTADHARRRSFNRSYGPARESGFALPPLPHLPPCARNRPR